MANFGQQVADFQRKAEAKFRAVARDAVQETVSMAQVPGPSVGPPPSNGAGGRMPIVSGFLRASIQGQIGRMPAGPTTSEDGRKYSASEIAAGEPVTVTILKWDPIKEETLFIGWTANYARYMEAQYGFMRGAAEVWDQTVKKSVKKMDSRFA